MSMKCPACGQTHWGRCTDKSVALWKRMTAGEYVDGDRYLSDSREDVPAREFAGEVNRLEKRCAALEAENARLREDKERLDYVLTRAKRILGSCAGHFGLQKTLSARERFNEINRFFEEN